MKSVVLTFFLTIIAFVAGLLIGVNRPRDIAENPVVSKVVLKPLEKYTIENLSYRNISTGKLDIKEIIDEETDYTSHVFEFKFNPNLDEITRKKISGQINFPKDGTSHPLIFMFRGYINQETYKTGDGTRRAAEVYANNGFITISPDFLGYGTSDEESDNIFETRFQTHVTALSLLKSAGQIEGWDNKNIFLWGHSNGGQIALTVLEITKADYATTLWAPVSKPFPYSVLYYTDDSVDGGKLIRRELAKFEELYDVEAYSLTNYLDDIAAPILIHQGGTDDAVPINWSNDLVQNLEKNEIDVTYKTYPFTDHNMRPSWDSVVLSDLEFFRNHIKD